MNNAPALLRTLIIYAVIVPLAMLIGYLLSNPLDTSTFTYVGILAAILIFPVLLRWHHPLLVFSLNSGIFLFFLPGRPDLWLAMTIASLGITMLQRALGGLKHLVSVPQVTWSLLCMIGMVVFTARLTGMGLHAFGSETSGGRLYIYLLCGIMVYFALSTRRIPPERAGLFVGLFFLSGLLACISDLWQVLPGPLKYIYLFFPARATTLSEGSLVKSFRLDGAVPVAVAVFSYLQATYGIRGIFRSGKSWRWLLLVLAFGYAMFGGFRSGIIGITLPFVVQFFIEGLHRTKLLFIFAVAGILGTAALVPLAPHLPYTVQRALTFLPLNIDVGVRRDADASANWRFDMWKALLPQVPQHLLLGKGYSISRRDIDMLTGTDAAVNKTFAENDYFALSGTYHSGPFSVVMTFGIWGVITIIWFWIASIWVLYRNYRYGDPALRTVNTFLFSLFMVRVLLFLLLAGDFGSDMLYFGGWIGLSVALNGGVCHPAPAPAPAANKYPAFDNVRSHLQPTFRRPNARV